MESDLSRNTWLFPYFYFEEKHNKNVFFEDKSLPSRISTEIRAELYGPRSHLKEVEGMVQKSFLVRYRMTDARIYKVHPVITMEPYHPLHLRIFFSWGQWNVITDTGPPPIPESRTFLWNLPSSKMM